MYFSSDIAQRIKLRAKNKNVSVKQMLKDLNLGFNMLTNMKKSMPKADNIALIADYLDCSVDYLLGRTSEQSFSISNSGGINNSIVGQNNSNVAINNTERPLSIQEQDLLRIYKNADGKHQLKLMDFAYKIEEESINE